jgi:anaerobic selenocysteine-containing dehydrogenase
LIVRTTTWSAGPGCHGGCGVLAHIEDGKLVKIEGDPDHPMNRGRLCSRCLAMTQYVDHPDRLRSPRKRVGERGEGKWQDISWEEAFDLIEEKMGAIKEEYGPESMIFSMGTGRDVGAWICLLAYNYGSPNVMFALSGIGCYSPRIAASETVLGDYCVFDGGQWLSQGHDDPRYEVPETIVIWGYNINASCPDNIFGHWVTDLMKKGSKVICIDPRLSFFASRADKWLQLRPGTDGALAMGFLNVIINEKLYDRSFVEKWTNSPHLIRSDTGVLLRAADVVAGGLPDDFVVWDTVTDTPAIWDSANVEFRTPGVVPALEGEYTVALSDGTSVATKTVWSVFCAEVDQYPVDKVAEITWLKEEDIVEAARLYANSKPATIQWGVAIDMTPAITPTSQAIAALWCLTGNLDTPGGNVIARMAMGAVSYALPGSKGVIGLPNMEADLPRIARDRYGVLREFIWRAQTDVTLDQIFSGDPYPIKGMWIQACNLIGGIGYDPIRWVEALKKLDFIAVVDTFMTPTAELADIVLPAATFLEKEAARSWWTPLQAIVKAIEVEGCKPDIEINFELARRFNPDIRWKDHRGLLDEILKPTGFTYEELSERGWVLPPEGDPTAPYHRHETGLLRRDKKPGFCTPSGKVELYSSLRESWGFEPLPHHEEPPFSPVSSPDLYEKYPLILTTGRRSAVFFNSEHRNIPWLRDADPDPIVELHPETGAALGIGNGEWVWIENMFGKCRLKAKLTTIVPRWLASATHGWWYPEQEGAEPSLRGVWDSSTNQLLPMGYQGKDGLGTHAKCTLCKVYRADSAPPGAYTLPDGGVIGGAISAAATEHGPAAGHGPEHPDTGHPDASEKGA